MVRATRRTRCRPRPVNRPASNSDRSRAIPRTSTRAKRSRSSPVRNAFNEPCRSSAMSRARMTRSRTTAVLSPGFSPSRSSTRGRCTTTRTSKRSMNGPLKRRRYFDSAVSSHSQAPGAPPPHGHGLVAATRVKRAGNSSRVFARSIRMHPLSSGCRKASRVDGANSPNSSRNSTPPWARLTSPGRNDDDPPPMMEIVLAEWCGMRMGGDVTSPWPPSVSPVPERVSVSPAAERMSMTSKDVRSSSGGNKPGNRCASIVLPDPGGPTSRRWCPPAAESSRPKRAASCPRTSARSGNGAGWCRDTACGRSGHGADPTRHSASSRNVRTARNDGGLAMRASSTLATGTTTPRNGDKNGRSSTSPSSSRTNDITIGATPVTGRTRPSRPSSPIMATPSTTSAGNCPSATRMATAIAASRAVPVLRCVDGARLTVMRCEGQWKPLDRTAVRMRSRDSRHVSSGRPRMVKAGNPTPICTSTTTDAPWEPMTLAERMVDSMTTSRSAGNPARRRVCATTRTSARIRQTV